MKRSLYTLICLLLIHTCTGQLVYSLDDDSAHIAHVEQNVEKETTDSAKAYAYFKLSALFRLTGDTAKINYYFKRGMALSKPGSFGEAASYFYKAQQLYPSRNIPAIEATLLKADTLLSKFTSKEAYRTRGYVWHAYGTFQQMKGDEKAAMDAFLNKALPYAVKSQEQYLIGNVNKAIATVFMNADQRDDAAIYLLRAINNIEKAPVENPIRIEALVEVYIYSAENYVYLHKPDSAKIYLDKASPILRPKPTSNLYLSYYYAEGVYFDRIHQYNNAITSFNKGIALGEPVPQAIYSVNRLKYAKYKALFNKQDYTKAVDVMLELVNNPVLLTSDKKIYYKELSEAYAAAGNRAEAYDWAKQYIQISDSLYEARFQNDVMELEKKYNAAENQKRIAQLQAANEKASLTSRNNKLLAWSLGGLSLFMLALALLGWQYYRSLKKLAQQKELSHQQQLIDISQQQQLKLAGALLQGEERERKRVARDLHDGLGGMLAGVKINLSRLPTAESETATLTKDLPAIITQVDKSVNELRRIARNMMPESLLSNGLETALKETVESFNSDELKTDFQPFNIEPNIAQDMQVTIFRIVQELLTNAVRHAHATSILVQCSQNENRFYITIEDNGVGFNPTQVVAGKGIGITNVKNRVDYLKGTLEMDSAPGEGATINIEFNVG
jgi:two-component system, NarL family, sensor kinase